MLKITPNSNNVILRLIEQEEKIGSILIPNAAKEKSSEAIVMIPPEFSYHPNGELKDSILKVGMKVRIPKGNSGTEMPEAPDGETWLCIPEDMVYYTIEEK